MVIITFVVDTIGNVRDVGIVQGLREDIDAEALRVVGTLNGWTPATQGGKKVTVQYNMPITFSLRNKDPKVRKKKQKHGHRSDPDLEEDN